MISNSTERYSKVAILLHWLIALALAGEVALGMSMPRDASGFALYQLHKSIGITILALTMLRLGWRLTHSRPAKLERGINGFLASAVHVGFYLVMILAPLTGWALVSTAPIDVPTLLFGVIPLPHLPLPGSINEAAEEVHEIIAFIGIGLFVLHVAGALRHHFLLHDRLLQRMAPGGSSKLVLGLLVAALAIFALVFVSARGTPPQDAAAEQAMEADAADLTADGPLADEEAVPAEDAVEAGEEDASEVAEEPEEVVAAVPATAGPPPKWTIQPGGSLRFTVDNSGTTLRGSFASWSGDIAFDPDHPQSANIAMRIQLGSATLGDATQDQMLKGEDFLSATAFPTATWRSTSVRRVEGNRYQADGTLTLKGVSRPQAITFTLSGTGSSRSVTGRGTIDRNSFSVGTGSNAANVGANVALEFAFDARS
ncbi:YceI family protein [Alteraurantiacibacter aestuarii]|uniref:YceI family protein n=1 Tax=Alteraurantiacibacter aestuarii TaxID=650004 RepID=UPI0031E19471